MSESTRKVFHDGCHSVTCYLSAILSICACWGAGLGLTQAELEPTDPSQSTVPMAQDSSAPTMEP